MLYSFLKFILQRSLSIHYQQIEKINSEGFPKEGPLIIATNHPNTFLDAIIIAAVVNRPIHFLSKGEAHTNPWANQLLKIFNLIPIYKVSKGIDNYNKNQNTFRKCYEILEKDGAILIFPEGVSTQKRNIHPFKKGLTHIAFGFLDKTDFNAKLPVIPIGINYDNFDEFNNKIQVSFGTPFLTNPWAEEYTNNQNQAALDFNKALLAKLQTHVIEVDKEDELLLHTLYEMTSTSEKNSFHQKMQIAIDINDFKAKQPQLYHQITSNSREIKKILQTYQLTSVKEVREKVRIDFNEVFINLLLFPLSLFGLIFSVWPFAVAKQLAKKTPKEHAEYHNSSRFAITTLLGLFYITLATICLCIYFGKWMLLTPLIFYASIVSFKKLSKLIKILTQIKNIKHLKANKEILNKLLTKIEETKHILSKDQAHN